jgi:hypothetical protein
LRVPKVGDQYFTGFENDIEISDGEYLTIAEVEGVIEYENKKGKVIEGRSITASDGIGYDCFWSEKHQIFVYGLED